MPDNLNRRELLGRTGLALGAGLAAARCAAAESAEDEPFGYCLNTSTIRERKLPLDQVVDLTAQAGYQGIEPWIREIETYAQDGGSLKDLKTRISDAGLTVASAIGFAAFLADDEQQRREALEQARRNMDLVQQIGGTRIAAPPVGVTRQAGLDLDAAAARYGALLEVGDQIGVVPQLELWGFSQSLSRLGELAYVGIESGHPSACFLPDVYHIYKGGSPFSGLRLLAGGGMHVFHVNDYPADPPRDKIGDADRVYPGDGVAPLGEIFRTLREVGFRGMLSLELFNREYWRQDPLEVARTGLQKTKEAVSRALA